MIRRTHEKTGEVWYQVFEVYYEEDGSIRSWTVDPVAPIGETPDELRQDISHFARALELPVLVEVTVAGVPKLSELSP